MKKLIVSGLLSCSLLLSGLIGGHKTEAASFGETVTDIALDYIGVPYVWGGSSPNGFDCSGFINYTYKQVGVSLPRTAADIYTKGQPVSKSNLVKGDLVFFTTYKAGASHAGIYIGDNKFVHASSGAGEVKVSSLNESYYTSRYIGSKRIGSYNHGWVSSNGKWYFYKNNVKQTGWIKDNSVWYYLASNGEMQTGWEFINNNWYYLNSSGAMVTGWIYSGGKWYFLQSDGSMAKNTKIGEYVIGSDGAWFE